MAVERLRRGELNSAVFFKTATHDKSKKHGSLSVSIPLGVSKPARTMRARLTHILASMMITIEMQLYFGHPPNIHLDVRGYVGGGINRPSLTRPSRSGAQAFYLRKDFLTPSPLGG